MATPRATRPRPSAITRPAARKPVHMASRSLVVRVRHEWAAVVHADLEVVGLVTRPLGDLVGGHGESAEDHDGAAAPLDRAAEEMLVVAAPGASVADPGAGGNVVELAGGDQEVGPAAVQLVHDLGERGQLEGNAQGLIGHRHGSLSHGWLQDVNGNE